MSNAKFHNFGYAVITAVMTVALSELVKYLSKKIRPSRSSMPLIDEPGAGRNDKVGGTSIENSTDKLPVRGLRWYTYQDWHIPSLTRDVTLGVAPTIDAETIEILKSFEVDVKRGFLPAKDPLKRLMQEQFLIWEDIADELPKFLGVRFPQVREVLLTIPKLNTDSLITRAELERAHFLLSLFAHSFVWGGFPILDYIPENIAVPLCEVSRRLEVPPLLCYFDIVLNNWRKLDNEAIVSMGNLATLNNFFDGRDESWFYLVTVEIEYIGARAIAPLYQLNRNISKYGIDYIDLSDREFISFVKYVSSELRAISVIIAEMNESMSHMREGCDPYIFFHRVRPFLAGWKGNPAVPNGVRYMGVRDVWGGQNNFSQTGTEAEFPYQQFSGGSAAQSSLIPFFDILLGVDHTSHDSSPSSNRFLASMRAFMPRGHRLFLEHIESRSALPEFVRACVSANEAAKKVKSVTLISYNGVEATEANEVDLMMREYDNCLQQLAQFRSSHMKLVAEYIIAQQKHGVSKNTIGATAGGRGTGGTELMKFLKPIRDNIIDAMISAPSGAAFLEDADNDANQSSSSFR